MVEAAIARHLSRYNFVQSAGGAYPHDRRTHSGEFPTKAGPDRGNGSPRRDIPSNADLILANRPA